MIKVVNTIAIMLITEYFIRRKMKRQEMQRKANRKKRIQECCILLDKQIQLMSSNEEQLLQLEIAKYIRDVLLWEIEEGECNYWKIERLHPLVREELREELKEILPEEIYQKNFDTGMSFFRAITENGLLQELLKKDVIVIDPQEERIPEDNKCEEE